MRVFVRRALNLVPTLVLAVFASGCAAPKEAHSVDQVPVTTTTVIESVQSEWVTVQYRTDPVDVASFAHMPGSGSLVEDAWYDSSTGYMIIDLGARTYHYCDVPASVWSEFEVASSKGTFYNDTVKSVYGCSVATVPDYDAAADLLEWLQNPNFYCTSILIPGLLQDARQLR